MEHKYYLRNRTCRTPHNRGSEDEEASKPPFAGRGSSKQHEKSHLSPDSSYSDSSAESEGAQLSPRSCAGPSAVPVSKCSLRPLKQVSKKQAVSHVQQETAKLKSSCRHSPENRKMNSGADRVHKCCRYTLGVLFVCLLCYMYYQKLHNVNSGDGRRASSYQKFAIFSERTESTAEKFPGQPSQLWKVVKSSVRHVLDSEQPLYPAVLLFGTDKSKTVVAADVAKMISTDFQVAGRFTDYQDLSYNLSLIKDLGAEEQKDRLDTWLHDHLKEGSQAAVILLHLEFLRPEAALLLHGYCDGENAPFKNALFVLVLYINEMSGGASDVETWLHRLWRVSLPEDKVRALLSRVANNIGIVR